MRHMKVVAALTLSLVAAVAAQAQEIGSIHELEGWWTGQEWQRYPFEQCSDADSDGRVAIGRTEWNEETLTLEFMDTGEMEILFYESGCTLGEALTSGNQLAMQGTCAAEGDDYTGIVTFERLDPYTIKVRTPMNDTPIVLAACKVDHSLAPNPKPAGKLPYGSRAGMDVTVLGSSALGTSSARLYIEHTREDARAFCIEYAMDMEPECVEGVMKESADFPRSVWANCSTGEFEIVYGDRYRFAGPSTKSADTYQPDYAIYPEEGGDMLDGSGASGYGTALATYAQLCPGRVKLDGLD